MNLAWPPLGRCEVNTHLTLLPNSRSVDVDRERREAIAKALYIAGMTVISAVAAVVLLVFLMAVRIADG